MLAAFAAAARLGIMIKQPQYLEGAAEVDTVVLDKTGTLTEGQPRVEDTSFVDAVDRDSTLAWIVAVEDLSEHPLARAIAALGDAGDARAAIADFEAVAGSGVRARAHGKRALIGTEAFLLQEGVDTSPMRAPVARWAQEGRTPVLAALDGQVVAAFAVADALRANAADVVARLKALGVGIVMLTGDRRQTAEAIARRAGIDHVIAEVLPDAKVAAVKDLQRAGRVVAMVGDGLNDAPALAQADVGIAMASGTDIAADAADVTLMRSDLGGVVQALVLARRTLSTMKQNLFWAFIYNVIGIPVAAGVLYPAFRVLLNPMIASGAMAFSSVSVVSNSLRLRRVRLP
jgi:Cu+-exporting ATPase